MFLFDLILSYLLFISKHCMKNVKYEYSFYTYDDKQTSYGND